VGIPSDAGKRGDDVCYLATLGSQRTQMFRPSQTTITPRNLILSTRGTSNPSKMIGISGSVIFLRFVKIDLDLSGDRTKP